MVEILLKYLEIRDWKTSFFQVIPQRKRYEADTDDQDKELEHEGGIKNDSCADSQKKLKLSDIELEPSEREVDNGDRLGEVLEPEATEKAVECDKSEDDKN